MADTSSATGSAAEPLIVLCAAPTEAELGERLRASGYMVRGVQRDALGETVESLLPSVVICELDPNAPFVPPPNIPVVWLTDDSKAAGEDLRSVFVRPIDESALVDHVRALIGGEPVKPGASDAPDSRARVDADMAGVELDPDAWGKVSRQLPLSQLSPEISALLERAERRVADAQPLPPARPLTRLSPEEELAAVLPAEILEALDEPIAHYDDDDELDHPPALGTRLASARPAAGPADASRSRTGAGSNVGTGLGTAPGSHSGDAPEPPPGAPAASTTSSGTDQPGPPDPQPEEPAAARFPTRPPPARVPAETAPPISQRPPPPTRSSNSLLPASPLRATLEPRAGMPESAAEQAAQSVPAMVRLSPPSPPQVSTKPPRGANSSAPPSPRPLEIPATLGPGDAIRALARAVRDRYTGALAFEEGDGMRRVVLREGDFVTAASGVESESLVAFLTERGDLAPDAARLARRLPQFGRHAGAALIAHGYLRQDELWPVLRGHAEWLISRIGLIERGMASIERQIPGRLEAEPAVFGGATGAEILVEIVRRAVTTADAVLRLGGFDAKINPGSAQQLLNECVLGDEHTALVQSSAGRTVRRLCQDAGSDDFASVLYALRELGIIDATAAPRGAKDREAASDPPDLIDEQALRARIQARKALVDEADYFALLGLTRSATSYDIRRAYVLLRREFEPARILTAGTADLRDVVDEIVEVLEEAYEVLRDHHRRERYRRALEAVPSAAGP